MGPSARKTVLVVEDLACLREAVQAVLGFAGYRVVSAEDGLEGVEAAHDHRPDLVLMDIDMPVMDGFEAAEELRRSPVTREIPIVAMTAREFAGGDPRRFLFSGYLQKPVPSARLLEVIARLTGSQSPRAPRTGAAGEQAITGPA
jgi:CheY-like chemotaxis protein